MAGTQQLLWLPTLQRAARPHTKLLPRHGIHVRFGRCAVFKYSIFLLFLRSYFGSLHAVIIANIPLGAGQLANYVAGALSSIDGLRFFWSVLIEARTGLGIGKYVAGYKTKHDVYEATL